MEQNGKNVFKDNPCPLTIDDILKRAGEYGRYQKIVNAMFCVMTLPAVFQVMISYFTVDSPKWKCTANSSLCNSSMTFKCSDDSRCYFSRHDWEYIMPHDYSIVTQFDLSCEKEWLRELTTSILFIGWLFGSIILGWFSDNYGRKIPLFVSLASVIVFAFVSAFMPNVYAFIVCRFCIGFFLPATFPQMFLLISEIVGSKHRAFAGLIIFLFAGIALSILGLKAYYIRNWKHLYIISTVPYIFVLCFFKFVPESFRYLRIKGRLDEAMQIFEIMAKYNKTSIENISIEPASQDVTNHHASPLDLFRTKNLAFKSIIQAIAYFVGAMTFFGVYLAAGDISGHLYRDYIFVTVIEIPISLMMMDFTERFGRKRTVMTSMLIGSIMCIALGFTPKRGKLKIVRVVFGMIGKVSISANCNTIQAWSVELYPTNIRGEGMGFTQVMSRLGAATAPWVNRKFSQFHEGASFIFMGIASLVSYFLLCFLPEMKGLPTSDAAEEVNPKLENVGGLELSGITFENPMAGIDFNQQLDA